MYAVVYEISSKMVFFACKNAIFGNGSVRGDTGTISGWSDGFACIALVAEPPEYLEYLDQIEHNPDHERPTVLLSDETLALEVANPPSISERLAALETWKVNLLAWLKEQVGDPPGE